MKKIYAPALLVLLVSVTAPDVRAQSAAIEKLGTYWKEKTWAHCSES